MLVRRRKSAVIVSVAALAAVIAGAAFYWFVYLGTPLLDEWYCKQGEAPINFPGGGIECHSLDSEPPAGATWDPLGNRPFTCDHRRGWTVIHRDADEDCLRDGLAMPTGWSKGPADKTVVDTSGHATTSHEQSLPRAGGGGRESNPPGEVRSPQPL